MKFLVNVCLIITGLSSCGEVTKKVANCVCRNNADLSLRTQEAPIEFAYFSGLLDIPDVNRSELKLGVNLLDENDKVVFTSMVKDEPTPFGRDALPARETGYASGAGCNYNPVDSHLSLTDFNNPRTNLVKPNWRII